MKQNKFLSVALASALTVSGLGFVAPTATHAAVKAPVKAYMSASLPINVYQGTLKNETEVLKVLEGSMLDSLRVEKNNLNSEAGLVRDLFKAEHTKELRIAELALEKAKVNYSKEKVKDPKGAEARWKAANQSYAKARDRAYAYHKARLDGFESKLSKDYQYLDNLSKGVNKQIEKERFVAKNSTGKGEVENALRLLNDQYRVQLKNIDNFSSGQVDIYKYNNSILDVQHRTSEIDLEIKLTQGRITTKAYTAAMKGLDDDVNMLKARFAKDLDSKKQAAKELYRINQDTFNNSKVYLQRLLSQTK